MAQRICKTKYCKNKTRKGRLICSTCDKREWREKYPMKAAFQTLRHNATRRGKPFTITFEYFQKFCYETKYMAGKGRSKLSFTVDCIINKLGYIPGNIQKLTKSANSSKGTKTLVYDYRHPEHTTVI
jgi:hypothetical protein